jgi:hypothetical protein
MAGWYVDDKYHREDGPAYQKWRDGVSVGETWYLHGKQHRIGAPAHTSWYGLGHQLYLQAWIQYSEMHRDDGPALQEWSPNGELIEETWYFHGKKTTPEEIAALLQPKIFYAAIIALLPQPIAEAVLEVFRAI